MKINNRMMITGLCFGLLTLQQYAVAAEGDWQLNSNVQALYGNYNGSINRDSIINAGAMISADYLETSGFSLGANYTKLKFNVGSTLNQQAVYGSIHYNAYFDALPGPLTLRLDGHGINNNDTTGNTDNVSVIASQISFLNYAKTFYADFGYARSNYQNNLYVDQFTPTLGFGLNDGSDWLQARGYFIKPSNRLRAQNKSNTSAIELKWTHWLAPDVWLGLEQIQLSGLAGERIYAVDGDAAAVYNLADIQQGSANLSLQWRLSKFMHVMLLAGNERYLDNTIGDTYDSRMIYINLSGQW
ncbi:MAG: hypothetical protein Q9M20_05265 [Mariprofundaceae bacterium]|nr:hypothetical protein [Mariprofundaceae bacterium]